MSQQHSNIEQIKRLLNMDKQDKLSDKIAKLETLLQDNLFLNILFKEDRLEYHKLLYNATFEQFHSRSIIQILGNYAKKFYVILEGSVDVFIRDRKDEDCLYGARQLVAGDCMNDITLITGDKSQVQYQVSEHSGNCSVLVLSKKDFSSFSHLLNINLDMNIFYLKNLPMFWNQHEKYLYLFNILTTPQNFVQNQQVFLEGDKSDLVYIIKKGEFGVYKHFQDLQFRKLNDLSHNKYLDSQGSSTVKLQEFHHNKNIQNETRIMKLDEMFGEEDIINRRHRSYSTICESAEGQLIVMSKATFKILLMSIEGVRNYILSRMKVKQTEISKILDKQSSQVSSARIHILERDQLKIATTQDFVKSRSFLHMSRLNYSSCNNSSNISKLNNMSKLGDSLIANNITDGKNGLNNTKNTRNNSNIRVVKSIIRDQVNHMLDEGQQSQPLFKKKKDLNRLSLPSIHQSFPNSAQGNKKTFPSLDKLHLDLNKDSLQENQRTQSNVNYTESNGYYPSASSQLGQTQKQEQSGQPSKRNKSEVVSQLANTIQIDNNTVSNTYPVFTPKGTQDISNINNIKTILTSSHNLEQSPSNHNDKGDSLRQKTSPRVSQNRRDSKFFDNFTRNSTLYLQKYQINQDKKAVFSVSKRNEQNDDGIDNKGKQLSEQIQQYITKYEQQIAHHIKTTSKTSDQYLQLQSQQQQQQPISPSTKIIYKKPITEEEYAKNFKKLEEQEQENSQNMTKQRNYKINFYQQKS